MSSSKPTNWPKLIIGLAAIALIVLLALINSLNMRGTAQTTGTVVAVERVSRDAGRYGPPSLYQVRVRYTAKGQQITSSARTFLPSLYSVGKEVPVRYDRADPGRIVLGSLLSQWWLVIAMIALGLLGWLLIKAVNAAIHYFSTEERLRRVVARGDTDGDGVIGNEAPSVPWPRRRK